MKLLLLGTGGYHPSDHRHTACLMFPEVGVVLDAGTAAFRVRDHIQTPTLDFFLTHLHLDHVIGLTYLFDIVRDRNVQHVVVHTTHDTMAELEEHLFAKTLFPARPPFELRALSPRVSLMSDGQLTWFPLRHPGGSLGYRIDWPDRSMAYVTDTTASLDEDYVRQIHGVDLLVHECYFPDGFEEEAEKTGHSCATIVAQVARAAQVGRMILVHVNPLSDHHDPVGLESMRAIFPRVELAHDHMEVQF